MTRVLIIDDEPQIVRALSITLRARGYEVLTAADGAGALAAAASHRPEIIVLDLGLPDLVGVEVIAGLRPWYTGPIVVLSARHDGAEKVAALDAGADDYVTKPFGMDELLARIRAAVRRAAPADGAGGEARVVTDDFTVDLVAKRVTGQGRASSDRTTQEIRLTPTEWAILELLVRNPGKLISQQQLLHEVWGPNYQHETNYLRVYLAQLRRKLEPDPAHPRYLHTEPGIGYRFEQPSSG